VNILSIQSSVAYGHVGNAAATLPMQLLGHEVWGVHTVQFSNHPGHGAWRGRVFEPPHIAEVLAGIAERGLLTQCDAILSGYLGEAANGAALLETVSLARAANPSVVYCCDPVMGDERSGVYVRTGIPAFFKERAMAAADMVAPNRFELELLTESRVSSIEDAISAARLLQARGPRQVMVSGLGAPAFPDGWIGTLLVDRDEAWQVVTPQLSFTQTPNGTGDVLAALLLAHRLAGRTLPDSLSLAVSGLFSVLERAAAENLRELPLVAAQEQMIRPKVVFATERK
jgi:pyridoxine kinase